MLVKGGPGIERFSPYLSRLLHWQWGNRMMITLKDVAKQAKWIHKELMTATTRQTQQNIEQILWDIFYTCPIPTKLQYSTWIYLGFFNFNLFKNIWFSGRCDSCNYSLLSQVRIQANQQSMYVCQLIPAILAHGWQKLQTVLHCFQSQLAEKYKPGNTPVLHRYSQWHGASVNEPPVANPYVLLYVCQQRPKLTHHLAKSHRETNVNIANYFSWRNEFWQLLKMIKSWRQQLNEFYPTQNNT